MVDGDMMGQLGAGGRRYLAPQGRGVTEWMPECASRAGNKQAMLGLMRAGALSLFGQAGVSHCLGAPCDKSRDKSAPCLLETALPNLAR